MIYDLNDLLTPLRECLLSIFFTFLIGTTLVLYEHNVVLCYMTKVGYLKTSKSQLNYIRICLIYLCIVEIGNFFWKTLQVAILEERFWK